MFDRLGILGVVAALVVSLVALVPPGAAEAVDPGALDVTDFVVLGIDGAYLKQNASVTSGDVGAVNATSGPYLAGSQETTIGIGVTVPTGSRVFGDSVKLKQGSTVGDVYANDLSGDGTVTGSVFTPVSFPLDVALPAVPVAQPGSADFDVAQGGSVTIDAGAYGILKARNDATVTLTGGVYEFSEWDIRDRVTVEVLAPSQIVVAGRVATGKNSTLTPGVGVEPYEIELTVLGVNGNTGKVAATPKAAKFGVGSTASAIVWAPNGTIWLRQNAQGRGQFIGRWVTVGIGVTVERSADVPPPTTTLIVSPAPGDVVFDTEPVIVVVDSTTTVSVDLEVDGVVVASSPINAGTVSLLWDTTGSVDGGVVLRAVVRDVQGTQLDTVSIDVVVANDDLSTMDRILVDYGQGRIDADMFIESGFAALLGSGVETRYQSTGTGLFGEPADPAADGEATQFALSLLAVWPNMSPQAQARVSSMGTVGGPVSGVTIPTPPAQQQFQQAQQSTGTTTCLGSTQAWTFLEEVYSLTSASAKAFECRTTFAHSVVYWNQNNGIFQTNTGSQLLKNGLVNQDDINDGGNGTPDQIDLIGEQQDEAWAVYNYLGYEQPDSVDVYVHDMGYVGGNVAALVLPTFVQYDSRLNQPGEEALTDRLARHEQFHVAQFDTLNVSYLEAAVLPGSVRWWMEATANWAAHQVGEATSAGSGDYSADLALLLAEPERSLVEEPGFMRVLFPAPLASIVLQVPAPPTDRAYGTFILAEYLDENLTFGGVPGSGDDAVLFTFRRIRDGFVPFPGLATTAQQAIRDVVTQDADGSETLSSMLTGFGVDNYLMDEPTSDGYTDPDAGRWKDQLNGLSPPLRPRTTEVSLVDGVSINGAYGDLNRGGAHYVEYTAPDGQRGTITFTVDAQDNVEYRALRIDADETAGPQLCDGTSSIVALTPGDPQAVPVNASCPKVTLVTVYADLDDQDRSPSWTATFNASINLLADPGFESGDYTTAWSTFTPPWMSGNFATTTAPIRSGTYAAIVDRSEGQCDPAPSGYEQVATVTPGQVYSGFAWVKHAQWGSGDVYLEVAQPDGALIVRDTLTVTDLATWQRLAVSFTPTTTTVRFRIGVVGDVCSTRAFAFDDTLLIEGQIGAPTNADFDNGLNGWEVIGQADGTVTIDTNGGRTVARLESLTGQPVGIEQWFDGYSTNTAQAIVSAATGTDSNVIVEIFRLDGTLVDIGSASVNQFQGWIPAGDVPWQLGTEGILLYRLTTTAAGPLLVDSAIVGTSP